MPGAIATTHHLNRICGGQGMSERARGNFYQPSGLERHAPIYLRRQRLEVIVYALGIVMAVVAALIWFLP